MKNRVSGGHEDCSRQSHSTGFTRRSRPDWTMWVILVAMSRHINHYLMQQCFRSVAMSNTKSRLTSSCPISDPLKTLNQFQCLDLLENLDQLSPLDPLDLRGPLKTPTWLRSRCLAATPSMALPELANLTTNPSCPASTRTGIAFSLSRRPSTT